MKCILVLCRVENMYQVVVLPIGDRNAGRACAGELRNSCRDAEAIRRKKIEEKAQAIEREEMNPQHPPANETNTKVFIIIITPLGR
jgi:hypothetical protein